MLEAQVVVSLAGGQVQHNPTSQHNIIYNQQQIQQPQQIVYTTASFKFFSKKSYLLK